MARMELNTTRMYELRNVVGKLAPAEKFTEVTRRIEDIERSMALAVEQVESDDALARETLVDALQRSQKIIVFMAQLQMNQAIDIDSLVPIILTPEEEQVFVADTLAVIQKKLTEINRQLEGVEDESVIEKVNFAREAIEETMVMMKASTTDYQTFAMYARDTQALADDTVLLLAQFKDVHDQSVVPGSGATSTATSTIEKIAVDKPATTTEESINGQGTATEAGEEESSEPKTVDNE